MIMPLTEDKLEQLKGIYQGKTLLSQTGCDWELFERIYEQEKPQIRIPLPKEEKLLGMLAIFQQKELILN